MIVLRKLSKHSVFCVQAPYDIMVTGPSYISLLEIANAEILGNVTDGSMDLRITESYQNLEPDFGNMVNVTLTLATSSQVSICPIPFMSGPCTRFSDALMAEGPSANPQREDSACCCLL